MHRRVTNECEAFRSVRTRVALGVLHPEVVAVLERCFPRTIVDGETCVSIFHMFAIRSKNPCCPRLNPSRHVVSPRGYSRGSDSFRSELKTGIQ
jgi:hypothetical protein